MARDLIPRLSTRAFTAFGLTVIVAGSLQAQVRGSIEAGSGTLRLASEGTSGIMLISPPLHLISPLFHLIADGQYGGLSEGGWQTAGLVRTGFRHDWGSLHTTVEAEGGWSRVAWGRAAGGWLGRGRLTWGDLRRGLSLSAGAGHTFTTDGAQPLSQVEAGSWSRVAGLDLGFRLRRTGLTVVGGPDQNGDGPPLNDTIPVPGGGGRRQLQDHYTDTDATVGWHRGAFEMEGGVGRRFGKPAARYTSWHLRTLYWITSRLGLTASMGRFPTDVVSGMPSGSFATLSMRVNIRGGPQHFSPSPLAFEGGKAAGFAAIRADRGLYLLSVRAPGARTVEVMGSFTQWEAMTLASREDGWWGLLIPLTAGIHEINVRIDGGPWQVPEGLRRMDDDFGGTVGVFIVD
ncbi:MAG: glycogen-binding domain-containing protein [Gemmatimonadota bacterium]